MKNYVNAKPLQIRGAPVFLHWSVLVVMGGCLATSIAEPLLAVIAAASYFSVILIHEYGHAWVASRLGYRVRVIKLSVIHGECIYESGYEDARDAALIAWGGPLAQFAAALVVWSISFIGVIGESDAFGPLIAFLGYLGPLVALVNLAPSPRMDGETAWPLIPMLWRDLRRPVKKPRRRSGLKVVK
jgi:Zn-dependent protease